MKVIPLGAPKRRIERPAWRAALAAGATLCLAVAGLLSLPAPASNASASAELPVVGPIPRAASVDVGMTTTVRIEVRDVEALYGADVQLAFDPTYVSVVDADPAAAGVQVRALSGFLAPNMIIRNVAENTDGTVWYAVTQVSPSLPVTGTGALAEIEFLGEVAGTSPITVTYKKIVRRDGATIASNAEDGSIVVTIGGRTSTPGPTPTGGPTAVRSATPTEVEPTDEPPVTTPTPSRTPDPTLSTPTDSPSRTVEPTRSTPIHSPTPDGSRTPTGVATPTATQTPGEVDRKIHLPMAMNY